MHKKGGPQNGRLHAKQSSMYVMCGDETSNTRTVMNIENMKGKPKFDLLYALIRALKINPQHVFYPKKNIESDVDLKCRVFISKCSDEELAFILPICDIVLDALRHGRSITIVNK